MDARLEDRTGRTDSLWLVAQVESLQVWACEAAAGQEPREVARGLVGGVQGVVAIAQGSRDPDAWLALDVAGKTLVAPFDPSTKGQARQMVEALRPTDAQGEARAPEASLRALARLAKRLAASVSVGPAKHRRILDADEYVAHVFPADGHLAPDADGLLRALERIPLVDVPGRRRKRRAPQGGERDEYLRIRARLAWCHARLTFREATAWARGRAHLTWTDLVSVGLIGLFKAIDLFDFGRNCVLSTYASEWIRSYIRRTVADLDRLVRVPNYVNADELRRLPPELRRPPVSLSGLDGPDADELLYSHAHRRYRDESDTADDHDLPEVVNRALAGLKQRERAVLRGRYFRNQTLEEVGLEFEVSRERIRQIESRALERLSRDPRLLRAARASRWSWAAPWPCEEPDENGERSYKKASSAKSGKKASSAESGKKAPSAESGKKAPSAESGKKAPSAESGKRTSPAEAGKKAQRAASANHPRSRWPLPATILGRLSALSAANGSVFDLPGASGVAAPLRQLRVVTVADLLRLRYDAVEHCPGLGPRNMQRLIALRGEACARLEVGRPR